jgi:hypothetical protein
LEVVFVFLEDSSREGGIGFKRGFDVFHEGSLELLTCGFLSGFVKQFVQYGVGFSESLVRAVCDRGGCVDLTKNGQRRRHLGVFVA